MIDALKDLKIGETVTTTTDPTIAMVVTSVNEETVTCTWIDNDGFSKSQTFKPGELEREKYLRPGNIL
jgi:hypothetical protein